MDKSRIIKAVTGSGRLLLPLGILIFGVLASYTVLAQSSALPQEASGSSQGLSTTGITFPVPELGNCKNKEDCRSYCNKPANMPACIAFSESHGLVNKEEASRAKRFADQVRTGNGPGGCNSPESCKTFCSDVKNIDACLSFAETHGFKDARFDEAKKLKTYLGSGGTLPGGCTSRDSCESYCGTIDHAEECLAFAQKTGIGPASPPGQIGRDDQTGNLSGIRKFIELAKRGEAPGGCTSKDACESYCKDGAHFSECVAFGERVGVVSSEEAKGFQDTGGKGPGGCDSEDACKTYCNDAAHQEECFAFAEKHHLIKPEEIEQAKNGWVRLRQGLEQAPPEVTECLKSTLGENVIQNIQSGELAPGPAIGEQVKGCFEKFGEKPEPAAVFKEIPSDVLSCLKEKYGTRFEKVRSGTAELTPQDGDAFRVCFERVRLERGDQSTEKTPDAGVPSSRPIERFQGFLKSAPPEVAACLRAKFGADFENIMTKLESTEALPGTELSTKIKSCFDEFRPQQGGAAITVPERQVSPTLPPDRGLGNINPALLQCLKENMNPEVLSNIIQGAQAPPEFMELIKKCSLMIQNSSGILPPPAPSQPPLCIQVITPARDPATGACKAFPTPCDVPQNWYKVERCDSATSGSSGGGSIGEVTPVSPSYIYPTYPAPTTNDSLVCSDYESCKRTCTDAANPYFGSSKCQEFRKSLLQPTSYGNFSLFRFLGAIFLPFLGANK